MRAARREVSRARWDWYSFVTVDVLDAARFGGPVWLTLGGEQVGLLFE